MRVVNVLIALYALLFVLPRWGTVGGVGVVVVTLVIDRLLKANTKAQEEKFRREQEERTQARNLKKISDFTEAGCRFFGSKTHIWEYAHLADLLLALRANGLSDLGKHQLQIVRTAGGVVAAFNRAGWPTQIAEGAVREVLSLERDRPIQHFVASELALRIEAERQADELKAIEGRVAARLASLKSRRREDMGAGGTAVYVIGSNDQSQSKIGISDNPVKRRASLQTGNPAQLVVHSSLWLFSRDHASILERHTHRALKGRGYFKIGEWFNIEPAIAERIISEVYDELVQHQILVENQGAISETAVDAELLEQFCARVSWSHSKRGNLRTTVLGKSITVFYKRQAWHWVCEGKFSDRDYPKPEEAQRAAIINLNPSRDRMLEVLLKRPSQQPF